MIKIIYKYLFHVVLHKEPQQRGCQAIGVGDTVKLYKFDFMSKYKRFKNTYYSFNLNTY